MVNTQEPRPARRPKGSLSARQWQELRQAARLSRSEGVEVTRYGFTFRPAPDSNRVRGGELSARGAAPSTEPSTKQPSKKKPSARDVRRAQEFQARQRWRPLGYRLARMHRRLTRDDVWTSFMRARLSHRQDVQLRLCSLLWRAWTTPQVGTSSASQDLSPRDVYRRKSFRDARVRMSARIAAAIQAQEEILLTGSDRPPLPTRGVDEAGLTTPASARRGKKSRGRGGRSS